MKYQLAVYFDGPRSQWSERLHESEVIYLNEFKRKWVARLAGRLFCGNTGRCSYVITHGDKTVENTKPTGASA